MANIGQVKDSVIKKCKDMQEGIASVDVTAREIDRIVVAALLIKYRSFLAKKDQKLIDEFGAVLKFYLTEDELSEYVEAIN